MLVYIIAFSLSLWGVREAEVRYEDKRLLTAYSLWAVLPPILIAGFRDSTVGTDMEVYILPIYEGLVSTGQGLLEFVNSYEDIEILYKFINYVAAQVTDNPLLLLLIIHSLIIIPLYVTAMKWRANLSPVLFMFVFYMIFFQESLSIVRQSIALSFSLLAFTYMLEKKYFKYFICSIVALGFHNTAVIAFFFPLVLLVIQKFPFRQYYIYYICISVGFVLFLLNIENTIVWLIENGYVDLKYLKYTSTLDTFEPALGATNLVVKVLTILYVLYILRIYVPESLVWMFFVMTILDFVFSLCALIVQPLDRISLYFRLLTCISIPYLINNYPLYYFQGTIQRKIPVEYIWGIILFFYWSYVYMYGNYDDTANYRLSSSLFD